MSNPIKIELGEWWFKGCFIQEQKHPLLKRFHVFLDTENQKTVDTCSTFLDAKKLCDLNEVKNYKQGYKLFF